MIIAAVLIDGAAGLAGGLLPTAFLHRNLGALLALASGVLVGTAFLDLLPEALMGVSSPDQLHAILASCLGGFLVFLFVENFLGSHATGQTGHRHDHVGPLILVGDSFHNITDGLAIAAAFMTSTKVGIITSFTVILHELPQEIADYTILISRGWRKSRALLALLTVQLTAFIGVAGTYWFSATTLKITPHLLAFSAGGFIYIAAADLLPQLHRGNHGVGPVSRFTLFLIGIGAIGALSFAFE